MNISRLIKNVKIKMDDRQAKSVNKKALQLEGLKKERIKLEGQAKILNTHEKESQRVAQARKEVQSHGTLAQLKKQLDEHKKKPRKENAFSKYNGGRNVFE